ncbi:MAG: hypothetical protein ACI4QD_01805 [Kiritimatiellia bacterium]
MKNAVMLAVGVATALAVYAAETVGKPLSAVAVPLGEVTVPIESVTLSFKNEELAAAAQSIELPEAERLAAMAKISDQDVVFRLLFKPGRDTNVAVRIAALNSLADMDVVRYMAIKSSCPLVSKAAHDRLAAVYSSGCERTEEECRPAMRVYAKRMRAQGNSVPRHIQK